MRAVQDSIDLEDWDDDPTEITQPQITINVPAQPPAKSDSLAPETRKWKGLVGAILALAGAIAALIQALRG